MASSRPTMHVLSDTGAYSSCALPWQAIPAKSMALYVGDGKYQDPDIHFTAELIYTNTAPRACRGTVPRVLPRRRADGAHRGRWSDPLEFRLRVRCDPVRPNHFPPGRRVRAGARVYRTCAGGVRRNGVDRLEMPKRQRSVAHGAQQTPPAPRHRRAFIWAFLIDAGGASLEVSDDGSFNLLVGA